MPLRLSAPTFSGSGSTYLEQGHWQVGFAARRVTTDKFFRGDHPDPSAGPGGQALSLRLNSATLSATYGISARWSAAISVPFSSNSENRLNPDGKFHTASASGVGDVSAMGSVWLFDPTSSALGNISLGVGIKLPTGSYRQTSETFLPSGVVSGPATQTIQQGDGGTAILTQVQTFREVFPRGFAYASADYAMSLRKKTDVFWAPVGKVWAVPDVYSSRAGLGYALLPGKGISLSLGGRVDGTASRNLITGSDDSYRKAGYTAFVEPGLSWVRAHHVVNLTVPVRVRHKYFDAMTASGPAAGIGGVPDYLVYASYVLRW
jgi:hypothetical protein